MKYDGFDWGISDEAPLTHRKYKCKICREWFKPSFVVNALWQGFWMCDHIKFCYEHTEDQMKDYFFGHIKYNMRERENDRQTIDTIVRLYLSQQKELDSEKELNKIVVSFIQS